MIKVVYEPYKWALLPSIEYHYYSEHLVYKLGAVKVTFDIYEAKKLCQPSS